MGRQRSASEINAQDETEPTSFNSQGACDVFKEIFKHILSNACKNYKKQLANPGKILRQKQIVDETLHHFVLILDQFRTYDKIMVIENDVYVINKILKLAIMDSTYF